MKMVVKRFVPSFLVLALSAGVYAESNSTPGLDKREANQERRIEQGEKSGELTARESKRLEGNEARLEKHEAAAKADGKVTPEERRRLNREASRNSKRIYRKKHNARTSPPAPPAQ